MARAASRSATDPAPVAADGARRGPAAINPHDRVLGHYPRLTALWQACKARPEFAATRVQDYATPYG